MHASEGRLWAASTACPSHLPLSAPVKLPGARLSQARLPRQRSQHQDRDHPSMHGGAPIDPHLISPPPVAAAPAPGARRQQQYQGLSASESTAEEREERHQGILQALDDLAAAAVPATAAAAAPEGRGGDAGEASWPCSSQAYDEERQCADAARLTVGGDCGCQGKESSSPGGGGNFEALRQAVDELGEGNRAAELIRESYEGRDLDEEAMQTMDPADVDHMPHPGDRYLPPKALPAKAAPTLRSSSPASASAAVTGAGAAARPRRSKQQQHHHQPLQFAVDGAALRRRSFVGGTFRFKSADKKSAETGSGGGRRLPGQQQRVPEQQQEEDEEEEGAVWGALHSRDEQHRAFRRSQEEAAAAADAAAAAAEGKRASSSGSPAGSPDVGSGDGSGGRKGGVLRLLRQRWEVHQREAAQVKALAQRLRRGARGAAGDQEAVASPSRLLEVALGRAAAVGLGAACVTELLTQQSVMSQLLGRYEGRGQIEAALQASHYTALAVLAAAALLTAAERLTGGGAAPRWRPPLLGLSPSAQLWLGRAAMVLFAALLVFETMHSNRPAFGTLLYLW